MSKNTLPKSSSNGWRGPGRYFFSHGRCSITPAKDPTLSGHAHVLFDNSKRSDWDLKPSPDCLTTQPMVYLGPLQQAA